MQELEHPYYILLYKHLFLPMNNLTEASVIFFFYLSLAYFPYGSDHILFKSSQLLEAQLVQIQTLTNPVPFSIHTTQQWALFNHAKTVNTRSNKDINSFNM